MLYDNIQGAPGALDITPSDANYLSRPVRAIYVGGTGNLAVTMEDGSEVTFQAIPVATILPIRVKQVKATGTTATLLIGLY
jgi:hypothetical protein